jgi:hypothetical protein
MAKKEEGRRSSLYCITRNIKINYIEESHGFGAIMTVESRPV